MPPPRSAISAYPRPSAFQSTSPSREPANTAWVWASTKPGRAVLPAAPIVRAARGGARGAAVGGPPPAPPPPRPGALPPVARPPGALQEPVEPGMAHPERVEEPMVPVHELPRGHEVLTEQGPEPVEGNPADLPDDLAHPRVPVHTFLDPTHEGARRRADARVADDERQGWGSAPMEGPRPGVAAEGPGEPLPHVPAHEDASPRGGRARVDRAGPPLHLVLDLAGG